MGNAFRFLNLILCIAIFTDNFAACSGFRFLNAWHSVNSFSTTNIIVSYPNETFPTHPAAFGPKRTQIIELPLVNIPNDGCDNLSIMTQELEYAEKVVLVPRGNCSYMTKIKNIQNMGGIGVIVGDNIPREWLFTMFADGDP
jgi:E3 ubiquitin-protein ligase RNF13